jgi:hypothetical protein
VAVLTNVQVVRIWDEGLSDRTVLYALRNVTAGDTIDVSADLNVVKRSVVLGTTVSVAISASQTGTMVTIPAGMTADAGWLLAWGSKA